MDISTKINGLLKKDFVKYKHHVEEREKNANKYTPMYTPHYQLVSDNDGFDDFSEFGAPPESFMEKCSIFFYEFSSTQRGCKHFTSNKAFFDFADKYGIMLEANDKSTCKVSTRNLWVACYEGRQDAFVAKSRSELVRILNENKQ